jgi:hypothetical protein
MGNLTEDGPRDFPFDLMCEQAKRRVGEGMTIYQKFTCAGCGSRLTMDNPNILFETGSCDKCDTITDIRKHGCNFLVHIVLTIDASKQGGKSDAEQSQRHSDD